MHFPHEYKTEQEAFATADVSTDGSGPDGTGWFCMHRKIIRSDVFAVPELLKCFVWCLARANPTASKVPVKTGRGMTVVELKAGQFITGRDSAGKALNMAGTTAMDRLRRLEAMQVLKLQSGTHFSIVSVVNWETYQHASTKNRQPSVSQVTPNRQPSVTDNNQTIKQDSPNGESMRPRRAGSDFVKPTVEEIAAYVATRPVKIDPERFFDHYEANGWVQGRGKPIRDWRAAARTWEKSQKGTYDNEHRQQPTSPARIRPPERKPTTIIRSQDAAESA